MYILQGLPQVGPKLANRLIKHFNSVAKVMNAPAQVLVQVDGTNEAKEARKAKEKAEKEALKAKKKEEEARKKADEKAKKAKERAEKEAREKVDK